MATKRVIHNSKLEKMFDHFNSDHIIKKGSTSVITQHPSFPTIVIVYTTDRAKMLWFKTIRNKVNFTFMESKREGSVFDEIPKEIYVFRIKKLEALNSEQEKYVKKHILSIYSKNLTKDLKVFMNEERAKIREIIKPFKENMKFFKIGKTSQDQRIKHILYSLQNFVQSHNVQVDLRLDSFMQLPNGDIVCTDPIYSTKET